MPIPTDTMRDMNRLNRWFAVSSVGLLVSFLWMIWEDYDRPWRGIQDNYMVIQAAMAHLDYLDTQTEDYRGQVAGAEKRVEAAQTAVAARAEERAGLQEELRSLNDRFDGIKITFGNVDSVVQVTRSRYETIRGASGEDSTEAKAAWNRLQLEEEEVAAARQEKESIEDDQVAIRDQLWEIDADVLAARKHLAALEKVASDAADKEDQYSNVLVKTVINAPLMDFTAPKGTASRHEVRQLVLPDIRQQLNYMETYTTDRCTTCHVSINDKAFSRANLARRFERAMPAINEALIRLGHQPLEMPDVPQLSWEDAPELESGAVTEFFEHLEPDQQRDYLSQLLERVNKYLTVTGRKTMSLEQPLLAHPNLDLYVHIDSPHPMASIGCTVCHEGNPQETDFVQAAHTPIDHHQEHEWEEKYYVTAAFVPNITFATVEHYWDRPMLPAKYAEAGCVKCHSRISDISEFRGESQAKRINLGRDLFVRVGCINCHKVDDLGQRRRVGPDLTRIGAKLSREFAERWVFNPKSFRPSTWMPHLFQQENNDQGSATTADPQPVLRTETEVSAMAHYLFTLSQPWEPLPIPDGLTGDASRGEKLFSEVGCLGCHANVAKYGREMIVEDLQTSGKRSKRVAEALYDEMSYIDRVYYMMEQLPTDRDTAFAPETVGDRRVFTRFAPELSSIGSKVSREWLFSWLKQPDHYNAETHMPSLRLTDQEASDIAAYLLSLKENDSFQASEFPDDQAHREMADTLVFTILSSQNSARRSRAIMEDEGSELSETLVNVLRKSLGEDQARSRIGALDLQSKKMMYLGSKMIAHYGCYACHKIIGFETATPPGTDLSAWGQKPLAQLDFAFFDHAHDHIREAFPETFGNLYPPDRKDLIRWAQGNNPQESVTHTHAAFAKHKMLNPRIWDRQKIKAPYDKLKMPNYYFTEQQADALVTYLLSRRAALVNSKLRVDYESTLTGAIADGRSLTRELNCIGCHKLEDNVATVHQYFTQNVGGEEMFDEVNAPPWLRGEGSKALYAWLYGFLNDVETLRPWLKIRMPSFNLSEDDTTTLVEYFAGISQQEAATLRSHLHAVDDYVGKVEERIAADGPRSAPDPAQWFTSDALRNTADFLASYCVKNRMVLSYDVDPNNTMEDLEEAFATVLDKTRFTAHLFDVRFPFADTPRPLVPQERFRLGEEFFYELKCLACHVLGDPFLEGSNASPSAPNLDLAHKRLRQEWSHQWFQEPAAMQPGTKMPQWFGSGNSAFASYPQEDRDILEGKYGATGEEQMQLLLDFMYNAGAKNYTALQPGGISAASDVATGDDEEEEEEEGEEEDDE